MTKCYIHVNQEKQEAVAFAEEIKEYLKQSGCFSSCDALSQADIAICLGGDGTLLRFSQQLLLHVVPIIAVNLGSLGFLTEIRKEDLFDLLKAYVAGKIEFQRRYFLKIEWKEEEIYALNEIALMKHHEENLTEQEVKVNQQLLSRYRCDGVIVASPTGSTAYSLSAGGPILNLDVHAMVVTPIAPHTLWARPIVVGGESQICIKNQRSSSIKLLCDGSIRGYMGHLESVEVTMSSRYIDMVIIENSNYFSVLREKLGWGESYVTRTHN